MEYDSFKAINQFDKRCIFSLLMISVSLCLHRKKYIYQRTWCCSPTAEFVSSAVGVLHRKRLSTTTMIYSDAWNATVLKANQKRFSEGRASPKPHYRSWISKRNSINVCLKIFMIRIRRQPEMTFYLHINACVCIFNCLWAYLLLLGKATWKRHRKVFSTTCLWICASTGEGQTQPIRTQTLFFK